MDLSNLVYLGQKGLQLSLVLSLPIIAATVIIGLLTAVFQAATQIQDQGLPTALKLIVGMVCLVMFQSWIGAEIKIFAEQAFQMVGNARKGS
jgi:type III secretion protein S